MVSNKGRILRCPALRNHKICNKMTTRCMFMNQSTDTDGYQRVGFGNINYKNKFTNYGVHRLVAEAFISNPNNLPEVNHKDGNKKNNNINNLEWCTCQDNIDHANSTRLRPHSIYENRESVKKCLSHSVECIETGQKIL